MSTDFPTAPLAPGHIGAGGGAVEKSPSALHTKNLTLPLVESFNSQLRQYVTALRRRAKSFAKTPEALARQIATLLMAKGWLRPVKVTAAI